MGLCESSTSTFKMEPGTLSRNIETLSNDKTLPELEAQFTITILRSVLVKYELQLENRKSSLNP